jgi:hypothetical protein
MQCCADNAWIIDGHTLGTGESVREGESLKRGANDWLPSLTRDLVTLFLLVWGKRVAARRESLIIRTSMVISAMLASPPQQSSGP